MTRPGHLLEFSLVLRKAFLEVAAAAMLPALGCASGSGARRDLDAMRAEMQILQRENADLAKQVEELSHRVDLIAARLAKGAAPAGRPQAAEPAIPPDLAVVKVEPPRAEPHRRVRVPHGVPALPTQTPVIEPTPERLAALGGARVDLAAESQAELDAAHRLSGLAAARALEAFTTHYPHHPRADNALLEAAQLRTAAGDDAAACALYARCVDEYPAGDALPDALERLAECHSQRGEAARARALFERVAADYPDTSAAKLAKEHLAAMPASAVRQGAVP